MELSNNYWFKMPYYHVRIQHRISESNYVYNEYELDLSEEDAKIVGEQYQRGKVFFNSKWINILNIKEIEIRETASKSTSYDPTLDSATIFYGTRIATRRVTRQFVKSEPRTVVKKGITIKTAPSKNVFIVHGRNHKPMQELKTMLERFGLNPIVLHEQPSGSITLIEKLERHSKVDYAFVILTPDDVGALRRDIFGVPMKELLNLEEELNTLIDTISNREIPIWTLRQHFSQWFKSRPRQNVVLEFGYFIGRIGRDRVCCLYQGNIELPSDMQGIAYIPFKDSVEEARSKIVKELKASSYEIKL